MQNFFRILPPGPLSPTPEDRRGKQLAEMYMKFVVSCTQSAKVTSSSAQNLQSALHKSQVIELEEEEEDLLQEEDGEIEEELEEEEDDYDQEGINASLEDDNDDAESELTTPANANPTTVASENKPKAELSISMNKETVKENFTKLLENKHMKNLFHSLQSRTSKKLFVFPMNLGTSYLFPNQWRMLFDFMDEFMQPGKRDIEAYTDFVYTERVKDSQTFWRLERMMNYLKLNPRSQYSMENSALFASGNMDPFEHTQKQANVMQRLQELLRQEQRLSQNNQAAQTDEAVQGTTAETNPISTPAPSSTSEAPAAPTDEPPLPSREELQKKIADMLQLHMALQHGPPSQEVEGAEPAPTAAKVLLVLISCMDKTRRVERLANSLLAILANYNGIRFVEEVMFFFFILDVSFGIFGQNPYASSFIQKEVCKNMALAIQKASQFTGY